MKENERRFNMEITKTATSEIPSRWKFRQE